MLRSSLRAASLAVAALLLALPGLAAELQEGRWSGQLSSKGRAEKVTYQVDPGPTITMRWGGKEYEFKDPELDDSGKLTFHLDFNETDKNPCELLEEESGRFEGTCGEVEAKQFRLLMIPPRAPETAQARPVRGGSSSALVLQDRQDSKGRNDPWPLQSATRFRKRP